MIKVLDPDGDHRADDVALGPRGDPERGGGSAGRHQGDFIACADAQRRGHRRTDDDFIAAIASLAERLHRALNDAAAGFARAMIASDQVEAA